MARFNINFFGFDITKVEDPNPESGFIINFFVLSNFYSEIISLPDFH